MQAIYAVRCLSLFILYLILSVKWFGCGFLHLDTTLQPWFWQVPLVILLKGSAQVTLMLKEAIQFNDAFEIWLFLVYSRIIIDLWSKIFVPNLDDAQEWETNGYIFILPSYPKSGKYCGCFIWCDFKDRCPYCDSCCILR